MKLTNELFHKCFDVRCVWISFLSLGWRTQLHINIFWILSLGELFLQRLEHWLLIEVSIGVKTIYGLFAERLWLSMTDKYCSMIFIVIIFCIIILARRCLHTVYMKGIVTHLYPWHIGNLIILGIYRRTVGCRQIHICVLTVDYCPVEKSILSAICFTTTHLEIINYARKCSSGIDL